MGGRNAVATDTEVTVKQDCTLVSMLENPHIIPIGKQYQASGVCPERCGQRLAQF